MAQKKRDGNNATDKSKFRIEQVDIRIVSNSVFSAKKIWIAGNRIQWHRIGLISMQGKKIQIANIPWRIYKSKNKSNEE